MAAMNTVPRPSATKPARRVASGIAAADGLADAHGGGQRDAERHHEQDGRRLQRDLVRGERGRADAAHQQRGRGKHAELQQ